MPTQTVMWTALPNGYSPSGQPRLSVHIAPRLVPDGPTGQLQQFPDFVSWPSTPITGWEVEFGDGSVIPAAVVTDPAASAARWSALFSPTSLVRGRAVEDYTQRKVRSYPVGNVIDFLRSLYTTVAAQSPEDHPSVGLLQPLTQELLPDRLQTALNQLESAIAPPTFALAPSSPSPPDDFAQVKRFYDRPGQRDPGPVDDPVVPTLDVHQMLSLAQDHPRLLRLLGVVVDLELLGTPPTLGSTTVLVRPTWTSALPAGGSGDVLPRTRVLVQPGVFRALSRAGGELADGFLRLDQSALYGVSPVDENGAALKSIDFAATVERAQLNGTVDTPDRFALPVLRASGLGLFRTGLAASLRSDRFVRSLDLDAGTGPGGTVELDADDLVQGARLDVNDSAAGPWRSLSARSGALRFTGPNVVEPVTYDEAFTTLAAAGAHNAPDDDLYLGETVALWDGWTLGAPRPGKVVDNADQTVESDSEAHPANFPLEARFRAVPGSLTRLRYGTTYRLRGRAVDLAGNSLPVDDPEGAHASAPVTFGRFEPIESPAVFLRTPTGPAETVERLVLRSNYDTDPVPPSASRHLVPPKVSQLLCEWHGRFDTTGPPSVVDAGAFALIAGREAQTIEDVPATQPGPPDAYVDTDWFVTPWLPDPLCAGFLLRGVAGTPTGSAFVPTSGSWPDLASVRLQVRGPAPMEPPGTFVDAGNHLVEIVLPKAEVRTVRLSTVPVVGSRSQFALWHWLHELGLDTPQLDGLIDQGRHWMFSPYRELVLVHAVRQPLAPPEFSNLLAQRNAGETFALLEGDAQFSRKSTARIDLEAEWFDYVDDGPGGPAPTRPDPNGPGWLDRPARRSVGLSTPVGDPLVGVPEDTFVLAEVPPPGARHEFGDTRHRTVDYLARAFSRFDDYFRQSAEIDFGIANPFALAVGGVVRGSVALSSQLATVDGPRTVHYREDVDFTVDPDAGTVTRGTGSSMPDVVSAAWVPQPNDRVAAAPRLVSVPSSTRPAPPVVLYVVPTFAFETSVQGAVTERTRSGGGLRVYLDRPWWSTGEGELLGVVLAEGSLGQGVLAGPADRVCTQWGVDPTFDREPTHDTPVPARFPLRVATGSNLEVPEAPGIGLAAAGHEVGFDEDRGLWFCDLEIDAGPTSWPFVRLALARYQPDALAGLELSPVVLADFVQLTPERTVTVVRTAQQELTVSLVGPGYQVTSFNPRLPIARVSVQRRLPDIGGDLGWETVSVPVTLATSVLSGRRILHTGTVVTPEQPSSDLRLVVEELEQFRTDGGTGKGGTYGERPVYGDVVPLG